MLSRSVENTCRLSKVFGDHTWNLHLASTDGLKYVCMDKLYADIIADKCLVYSFGLADNWSFEESMTALGCRVAIIYN